MRIILMLIKKEFLQVFRSPLLMSILIVAPMVQFILFPFTADYEIRVIDIAFIDNDNSSTSHNLITDFNSSPHFRCKGVVDTKESANIMMKKDKIDFLVEIPADFEKNMVRSEKVSVSITANAINSVKAGIGCGYVQRVIAEYLKEVADDSGMASLSNDAHLFTTNIYWYNEMMNYKNLIVPGILVILVTLIGAYVTALNLVREKEIGTIEQINVTPIRRWQFLLGKMIPFWILGMFEFVAGLFLMKIIFSITVQGSIAVLLFITAIYLFVMLGLGFFISAVSETQLQAMFIVFFLFIVFVLLSGLFTPAEGMPEWASKINYLNPMSFYMDVIKKMVLKGCDFADVQNQTIVLSVMAVFLNTAAIVSYKDSSK